MVPRASIKALDLDTPPEEVLRKAVEIGHSRIPVYRGTLEQIVGVVVFKDLLRSAAFGEPPVLAGLLHPPVFVPETSRISALLREFQRNRQNLAMAVDEYGAIAGLVTVEDLLEEIVGDIRDERAENVAPAERLPDGSAIVDGLAWIDDVRRTLGIALPESTDHTTVAGFIIASLDAIPSPGTSVTSAGYRWTVLEMDGPRITKAKLQRA